MSSLVAQQVKDPVLSLMWLRLLLWHRFDPWSRHFHMPWVWPSIHQSITQKQTNKIRTSKIQLNKSTCETDQGF